MIIFNKEEKKIIESFSDINEKNYKLKILSLIGNWKINNRNNYDYLILEIFQIAYFFMVKYNNIKINFSYYGQYKFNKKA